MEAAVMSADYDKLNSLILDDIRFHKSRKFGELLTSPKVAEEASRIAREYGRREPFRVIDGQLQKLRRRGIIKFAYGAWWLA